MEATTNKANGNPVVIHTTPDDWSEPGTAAPKHSASESTSSNASSKAVAGEKSLIERLLLLVVGIVLVLVGIPMLILPGPGLVAIVAGGACIASALGLRRKSSR